MEQVNHIAGVKIRRWRKAHNVSARELGEQLDPERREQVSPHAIYNWEERGRVARPKYQRWFDALGICEADDWLRPALPEDTPAATGAEG